VVERAKQLGDEHIFSQPTSMQKKYSNLKDVNLKKSINSSCAFHHAGMVRSDRDSV